MVIKKKQKTHTHTLIHSKKTSHDQINGPNIPKATLQRWNYKISLKKKKNVKVVKVLLKCFVLVNVKSHFVAYCTFKQRRDVPDVDASRFHELTERDL